MPNTMTRTPEQNKRLHLLIAKLGITAENKEDLVSSYSNGRVTSSADMTAHECDELLRYLQQLADKHKDYFDERAIAMRRKFFALARDKQWIVSGKIDYVRTNNWLLHYSYLHKTINEYNYSELPKLLSQFEHV